MPSNEQISLSVAFGAYELNLKQLHVYLDAMTPCVKTHGNLEFFVKGVIVVAFAHYEEFLQSLLTSAVAARTEIVRSHLMSGNQHEQDLAQDASHKTLTNLIHGRVSFRKAGASVDRTFRALFDCSPWPNETTRDNIVEFGVVRNTIVHAWGTALGVGDEQPYVARLKTRHVFSSNFYGEYTTYHINPLEALKSVGQTMPHFEAQYSHLKQKLLS